ncbi:hypothetical protein JCM8547_006390 [Rhodosporidiobolus lusitaniae]
MRGIEAVRFDTRGELDTDPKAVIVVELLLPASPPPPPHTTPVQPLPTEIIQLVLEHVYDDVSRDRRTGDYIVPLYLRHFFLPFLLVSKTFHGLALPLRLSHADAATANSMDNMAERYRVKDPLRSLHVEPEIPVWNDDLPAHAAAEIYNITLNNEQSLWASTFDSLKHLEYLVLRPPQGKAHLNHHDELDRPVSAGRTLLRVCEEIVALPDLRSLWLELPTGARAVDVLNLACRAPQLGHLEVPFSGPIALGLAIETRVILSPPVPPVSSLTVRLDRTPTLMEDAFALGLELLTPLSSTLVHLTIISRGTLGERPRQTTSPNPSTPLIDAPRLDELTLTWPANSLGLPPLLDLSEFSIFGRFGPSSFPESSTFVGPLNL